MSLENKDIIMMNQNFKSKRQEWADKTANSYHEMASKKITNFFPYLLAQLANNHQIAYHSETQDVFLIRTKYN